VLHQVGVSFDLNGTYQLLVYADDNMLGGSVHTVKQRFSTAGPREILLEFVILVF